jgi:fumarate reductase flavoprotein subunit
VVAARTVAAAGRGGQLHTPRLGLLESNPGSGRVDFWKAMLDLTPGSREVCEIWVNAAGERFAPEDCSDVTRLEHAVLRQPGAEFWVIVDSTALARTGSLVRQWDGDRFVAKARANSGIVTCADDVATLAERAGVDPSGLKATVTAYNAATAAGSDEFGRAQFGDPLERAPFFAVRTTAALLCSFGGIAVDPQFRALRADGAVIDSLHAVGEVIGMGATSGAAFCGGMSVTPALAFGRLLGRRFAGAPA